MYPLTQNRKFTVWLQLQSSITPYINISKSLSYTAIMLLVLILPLSFLYVADHRVLHGISVWAKPLKFTLSLFIYIITLLWLTRWISPKVLINKWFTRFNIIVSVCIIYEIIWITGAAAFGVQSHFNTSSTLMETLYILAGVGAVTLTSAALVYGVLIARNHNTGLAEPMYLAIWSSCIVMFLSTLLIGVYLADQTSHLVGGNAFDTEAIPLLGWATDGGDLRVAHFFATHAFHFIPIVILLMSKIQFFNSSKTTLCLVIGYSIFIAYTFFEATNGRPFLHPLLGGFYASQ